MSTTERWALRWWVRCHEGDTPREPAQEDRTDEPEVAERLTAVIEQVRKCKAELEALESDIDRLAGEILF